MITKSKIYFSILLETASLISIVTGKDYINVILFFILHFVASWIITGIIVHLSSVRINKKLIMILLTALNTVTLFVGYIISIYLLTVYARKIKNSQPYTIHTIDTNIIFNFPSIKRNFGEGAAYISPSNKTMKENLISIFASENSNKSVNIIKRFGNDPEYEIRLYAFQKINLLKKNIIQSINDTLKEFEKNQNDFSIIKKLVMLYWDLYNLKLTDEELADFYLQKIIYYIEKSQQLAGDGEICFIHGNIMKIKNDYNKAIYFLERSLHYGMDTHTVYPLLAEIYYEMGDFKKVREILLSDPTLKLDFSTYAITEIWEAA